MYLECDLKKKNYAKNSTLNDGFSVVDFNPG